MELVLPDVRYKKSYLSAQREFRAEGTFRDLDLDELRMHFAQHVRTLHLQSQGRAVPSGFVPSTEYWMVEGDLFLGRISLRHRLNASLEKFGGHIGYAVRPTERSKGYASRALALVLPKAHGLGLGEVLLTCDDTNVASIKVIEKNGGRLQDKVQLPGRPAMTRRYLISVAEEKNDRVD
jgi:predicted acetyltransferase